MIKQGIDSSATISGANPKLSSITAPIILSIFALSIPLLFNMPILALIPVYLIGLAQLIYQFVLKKKTPIWIQALLILAALASCLISVNMEGYQWIIIIFLFTLSLKFFELKRQRDFHFLLLAALILIASALLNFTNLWSGIYLLIAVITLFGLFRFQYLHLKTEQTQVATLKRIVKQVCTWALLSLPLTFLLFFTVPRINPIGLLPALNPQSHIGLSDHLTLDNVGSLQKSGKVAFRVEFQSGIPEDFSNLYWRVLTLENYDGQRWDSATNYPLFRQEKLNFQTWAQNSQAEPELIYEIMMEPDIRPWLPSLQTPVNLSNNISTLSDWTIERTDKEDSQRFRYKLAQYTDYQPYPFLSDKSLALYQSLPKNQNPKLSNYGQALATQSSNAETKVAKIKQFILEQAITYTTSPARLPKTDTLDHFIYNTKEGYCEHFASSMTYLLRAAGIPSRIAIGFAGGEWNHVSNYLIVRQDHAHAWVEYWIEGTGWIAFDPTLLAGAAIAARPADQFSDIQEQVNSASNNESYQSAFTSSAFALNLDALNYQWYRWIVQYDKNQQQGLLEQAKGWNWLNIALAILCAILIAWSVHLILKYRREKHPNPIMQEWLLFERFYQKQGIARQKQETVEHFAQRITKALPENKEHIHNFKTLWMQAAYSSDPINASDLHHLKQLGKKACRIKSYSIRHNTY